MLGLLVLRDVRCTSEVVRLVRAIRIIRVTRVFRNNPDKQT